MRGTRFLTLEDCGPNFEPRAEYDEPTLEELSSTIRKCNWKKVVGSLLAHQQAVASAGATAFVEARSRLYEICSRAAAAAAGAAGND